jgi:hypothetical protein
MQKIVRVQSHKQEKEGRPPSPPRKKRPLGPKKSLPMPHKVFSKQFAVNTLESKAHSQQLYSLFNEKRTYYRHYAFFLHFVRHSAK